MHKVRIPPTNAQKISVHTPQATFLPLATLYSRQIRTMKMMRLLSNGIKKRPNTPRYGEKSHHPYTMVRVPPIQENIDAVVFIVACP